MKKSFIALSLVFVFPYCVYSQNVGIGTTTPVSKLEVKDGTLTITNTLSSANLVLNRANVLAGTASQVSFFDNGTPKWALGGPNIGTTGFDKFSIYSYIIGANILTIDGPNVGIGTINPQVPLHVIGPFSTLAVFENFSALAGTRGLITRCNIVPDVGTALIAEGGHTGVEGLATLFGPGNRYGIYGMGRNGTNNYGVYGTAAGGSFNHAGFFSGDVFSTGNFISSDSKLKKEIKPLKDALTIINNLKPSVYRFKTTEYKQMNLPEGTHYGLLANEVSQVMPYAVRKAVQPPEYEMMDGKQGKKLSDEVKFDAVNYTEFIPVLIGAVKEQQLIITTQGNEINELKARIAKLEKLITKGN